MKDILFLGSLHDDPGDKERLTASIKRALQRYDCLPHFIAFEWAKSTYEAGVKKRRALFFELKETHPNLPEDFCRLYAEALAHEPDVYGELLHETNVIWMLEGRSRDDVFTGNGPLIEEAMISAKKNNLASWLLPKIPECRNLTIDELLRRTTVAYLSESERLESQREGALEISRSIETGRDLYMFNRIQNTFAESPKQEEMWAAVIVGTAHLAGVPGSLFSLCEENFQTVSRIWSHEQEITS